MSRSEIFDELHAARFAAFFFQLLGAAERESCLSRRFVASYSLRDELFDLMLVVKAQLVVEFGFDGFRDEIATAHE